MKNASKTLVLALSCVAFVGLRTSFAQDWPQWRGPNRDGKASGFKAPDSWPKELTRKWNVEVGDGVATPALVGDKLYVFTRQEGNEVLRCLDAASGKEVWQDKYEAAEVQGPANRFTGPRSSPTVAEGKVVTLGVQGTLCCYEADSGKNLWRKDDLEGSIPRFSTASSPIVVDGMCIAQLGGSSDGVIAAYDLASGNEKWQWKGDGPAYGSPVLMNVDGSQVIVAPTDKSMVAIAVSDGKLVWQIPYSQGRYNAATPMVNGQTLIYAGPNRGATAEKLVKKGDEVAADPLWSNPDNSLQYNTPVLKDGLIFGLSNTDNLFCINLQSGKTSWTAPLKENAAAPQAPPEGGRRRRGGGGGGYGSIVDAGSVLAALSPGGELIFFAPNGEEYKQLAKYKVAESGAYAYPVLSGNRVFVKDQNSLTLWTLQ